jgi:shikimate kinase
MKDGHSAVFLVGFMGVGKTTSGRALARLLGWEFVDLDERIVDLEGKSIADIFAERGEAHFRALEAGVLSGLRGRTRVVVACGGGTYAEERCRALIDAIGRAVWLRSSLAQALARCAQGPVRPMLRDAAQAESVYLTRVPSYRMAPLRVDVEGLAPEEVAVRIAALL